MDSSKSDYLSLWRSPLEPSIWLMFDEVVVDRELCLGGDVEEGLLVDDRRQAGL